MRLIDADEFLEKLDHSPLIQDAMRKAFDHMPTIEPEQRWIPVSERLPEDSDYHDFWETPDGAVMWCKGTGEIGVGWYYESTKTWCDLWDNGVRDVIAWMPLPTPWEGGQDDVR